MDLDAVGRLHYFSRFEKRADGQLIDWSVADETVFTHLDHIREEIASPIQIIRETHTNRAWPAVDWVTDAPMGLVFQVVGARPLAFGLYAGTHGPAYHVDTRQPTSIFERYRRWMAVRPSQKKDLGSLRALITSETEEWVYLRWDHRDSFAALLHIMDLASENKSKGGD